MTQHTMPAFQLLNVQVVITLAFYNVWHPFHEKTWRSQHSGGRAVAVAQCQTNVGSSQAVNNADLSSRLISSTEVGPPLCRLQRYIHLAALATPCINLIQHAYKFHLGTGIYRILYSQAA